MIDIKIPHSNRSIRVVSTDPNGMPVKKFDVDKQVEPQPGGCGLEASGTGVDVPVSIINVSYMFPYNIPTITDHGTCARPYGLWMITHLGPTCIDIDPDKVSGSR